MFMSVVVVVVVMMVVMVVAQNTWSRLPQACERFLRYHLATPGLGSSSCIGVVVGVVVVDRCSGCLGVVLLRVGTWERIALLLHEGGKGV